MARKHGVAFEAEKEVATSAHCYAPSIPTFLASRKQKKFTNAPLRQGRMRKFEGTSKVAMKVKRAHAKI
jgi:hypothetical protein